MRWICYGDSAAAGIDVAVEVLLLFFFLFFSFASEDLHGLNSCLLFLLHFVKHIVERKTGQRVLGFEHLGPERS